MPELIRPPQRFESKVPWSSARVSQKMLGLYRARNGGVNYEDGILHRLTRTTHLKVAHETAVRN